MIDTNNINEEAALVAKTHHHPFSPSRLQQLKECPGSAKMQEGLIEVPSPEADEGTMLHDRIVSRNLGGLTAEQEKLVTECIQFMDGFKDENLIEVQQEFRLTVYKDEAVLTYGTADVVMIWKDYAIVIDWKFGRNPVKDASRNLQLAAYALATMQKYGVRRVKAIIYQPRIHACTSYEFTRPEAILHNIGLVIAAAKDDDKLVLRAGDACRYCLAKAKCPAFHERFESLGSEPETNALADPNVLLAYWEKSKVVEKFLKELKEAVEAYVNEHGELGGWKFKEKPGNREFTDTTAVFERMSDILTPGEFSSLCKVSVATLVDFVTAKLVAAATAKGEKLTKTNAKKLVEEQLGDLITRGKSTRSLVKE